MWNTIQRIIHLIHNKNNLKNKIFKITKQYPTNTEIYQKALTHKSNETLEFLGDAILGAITSHYLFKKYPTQNEGFLTAIKSRITNRNILNKICKNIKLHQLIQYNQHNKNQFTYIYGNTLEALIAAIYIDKGYKQCYKFITQQIIQKHINLNQIIKINNNYKGKITEWAQKQNKKITFQAQTKNKQFITTLHINNKPISQGTGQNKKTAEQQAAQQACQILNIK